MKPVKAVVELGPNYVFHLLACARIGFDSDYADRYRDALASEDLAWLQDHKSLLAFGDGRGGDLVGPLVFMPAYLNLDSAEKISKYFDVRTRSLRSSDLASFLNEYESLMRALEHWMFHGVDRWLASFKSHLGAIETFAGICERAFAT